MRLKDFDWDLPAENRTWQQAEIAVLMDLRDELKTANRRLFELESHMRSVRKNTSKVLACSRCGETHVYTSARQFDSWARRHRNKRHRSVRGLIRYAPR